MGAAVVLLFFGAPAPPVELPVSGAGRPKRKKREFVLLPPEQEIAAPPAVREAVAREATPPRPKARLAVPTLDETMMVLLLEDALWDD